MIMEMERMPVYRAVILSVTGEVLCIDGTKKVCIKYHFDQYSVVLMKLSS